MKTGFREILMGHKENPHPAHFLAVAFIADFGACVVIGLSVVMVYISAYSTVTGFNI